MKRRRFSLDVRPGAVALLTGLYFLLPLRWCARLALAVAVHELGHVAALVLCGAEVYGLRMEGRALHAAVTALAGERAAERLLDALGLVLPVALMGFGVVLFARGMGLALGVFGAWLALLQPGMTCQGGKHDVKYSYYHM